MGRKNNEKFLFNNKKYIDFDDITQNLENKNAELIEFMLFKSKEEALLPLLPKRLFQ